ncbi:hypothetical protein ANRL1_00773 [Anaerolineae bacterium]|nr:hypothetical protein ANRL1_00773 [Anaerolineae bacterium]
MHSFISRVRTNITPTIILGAILALAAFLRFYRLDAIPPGLNQDEAFNLLDVLNVLRGQFSIFFPANTGREPLWFYLNTATVAFFGANAFALRFSAALIGTVTVALVFGFARDVFRSTQVAALASLLTAISVWHIFFSRYGLRIILAVPLTLLALWWFWRGLTRCKNTRRYFALAGVGTSLAVYTYLSCRLLPFVLILLTAFAMLTNRARARAYFIGLAITGIVALLIFLPLGIYFVAHPDDFIGHTANLSILDPRVNGGDILRALWNSTIAVAGMFLGIGDHEAYRNIPNRPVFDPFIGAFFIVGIVAMLVTMFARRSSFEERVRAFLIAAWFAFFMLSSITSDDAPSFLRTLPAVPAVMMLAAWGVSEVWNRLRGIRLRRLVAGAFAVLVCIGAIIGARDYFVFGESGVAYFAFDTHVADTANWITAQALSSQVYLAPLWARQGTLQLITRRVPVKSFESRDTVILPARAAGKDALIVYPWEQEKKAQKLGERLGALGAREVITGSAGFPVALAYRVPAQNLPDEKNPLAALAHGGDFIQPQKTIRAVWNDSLELLGYSVDALDAPQRNLEVTLFFHALKPMADDYTFSVKARDDRERTWGQDDKWAGDNSYATSVWSPGDLIVEKFYPGLNACAPAGDYRVTIEVYNPKTMQTLALSDRDGSSLVLDMTHARTSQGNRIEDLEISQPLDLQIAPSRLLGYTLTPNELRAGDPFSLSLYWRGQGNGATLRATIRLRDAAKRDMLLAEQDLAIPADGRGLCALFDVRVPSDLAPGMGALFVNGIKITDVNINK